MFGEVFSFFFFASTFLHCANYRIQTRLFLPKIGGGIPFPFPTWKEKTPVFTKAVTHKKPNQTKTFPLFPSIKYTVVGRYQALWNLRGRSIVIAYKTPVYKAQ